MSFDGLFNKFKGVFQGAPKQPNKGTWLFKVSKKGEEFLVLGTSHIVPLESLPKPVIKHTLSAKRLVTESTGQMDSLLPTYEEMMDKFKGFSNMNMDDQFDPKFDPQTTSEIVQLLRNAGPFGKFYAERLNSHKSWVTLVVLDFLTGMSDQAIGMNASLQEHFKDKDGLETLMDQLIAYDIPNLPEDEIQKRVREKLEALKNEQKVEVAKESADYKQANIQRAVLEKQKLDTSKAVDIRTQNWVKPLLALVEKYPKKEIVCDVGLNHLVGDAGLLNLLDKQGYKIQQCDVDGHFFDFNVELARDPGKGQKLEMP